MNRRSLAGRIEALKRWPILALALAFSLLALMHNAATPIYEAPDEVWHDAYVRWLAAGRGLPSLAQDDSGANQESAQPPLYYAAAALIRRWFPDGDLPDLMWHNPGFGYQAPGTVPDNKAMLVHTSQESWPWRGATLAIHATRVASWAFGLTAVLAVWGLAWETWRDARAALLAAALVAFHPQFVFISSVVSNDSAAAALATLGLWLAARALRRGLSWRRGLLIGAVVGLAALSKTSALLLIPLAGAALAWEGWRARASVGRVAATLGAYLLGASALGGWWYARNLALYGDALGLTRHVSTLWGRTEPVSLGALLPELPLLVRSFWAAYGWGHVTWPDAITWALTLASLCFLLPAVVGCFRNLDRLLRRDRECGADEPWAILWLALLWLAGVVIALLRWMQQVQAPHGRLLFPALGAWALLMAYGFRAGSLAWHKASTRIFLTALACLAILAPGARILATFAPPRLRDPDAAARGMTQMDLSYSGQARLVSIDINPPRSQPGDTVKVRACWEALLPMAEDYTIFVHLLGPGQARVAERHTYPGLGRFPTTLWPEGYAFCDTYRLAVAEWADAPLLAQAEIGLFNAQTGERLQPADAGGQPRDPALVGAVAIVPARPLLVAAQHASQATLGSGIRLLGWDAPSAIHAGETLTVTLYWEALADVSAGLTAFVHVWQPGDATPVAQHDAAPRKGWFPTYAWRRGDVIPDAHPVSIPAGLNPGRYALWAGLYDPITGTRLAVSGVETANDLIPLGEIEVR